MRESVKLLKGRLNDPNSDPTKWPDVQFALEHLSESMGTHSKKGRTEVLNDLMNRAKSVEESHDPTVISELTQALITFLDEELDEALEDANMSDQVEMGKETEGTMDLKGKAEADGYAKYKDMLEGDSDDMDKIAAYALLDDFKRYADESDEGYEKEEEMEKDTAASVDTEQKEMQGPMLASCEACGYENEVPYTESAAPQTGDLKEAEAIQEKLTAQNEELVELRAFKRMVESQQRAVKAIADAKLDGIVDVEDLMSFPEKQWKPLLEKMFVQGRTYGTGERAMPTPHNTGQSAPPSAVDVFKTSLESSF